MSISVVIPSLRRRKAVLPRIGVGKASAILFAVLAVASWTYIVVGGSGISELFAAESWRGAWEFVKNLLGVGLQGKPAFLRAESWRNALALSIDTLAMSVLAAGIAGAAVLLTFLPAARNVAFGEIAGAPSVLSRALYFLVRAAFIFTRGVPELLWAMLIVFVLSPGILPGALALAVHNYGIVGKLSAEVVENLDTRPARALRAAGASNFQTLLYAILPQALPQLLTYLLYRWEVIIRTTIVVGFVAAGGLGREFRLRMSFFHYDEVMLLLLAYLILVVLVDLSAAG
ncbi:MAG: ABC transporter permease subunit, partial [Chloroflexi bacterium]|nr:ABC transporter permease subunit [Chloroflexota bacterium]